MSLAFGQHLANAIPALDRDLQVAGIIGDRPSQYAKSPSLWNATFRGLGIRATFLPFDTDPPSLEPLVGALRSEPRFIGAAVTVPYKIAILPLLDDIDPLARQIGAVNIVRRGKDGRLTGFNTDGQGGLDSLTRSLDTASPPFFPVLDGRRVVVIGAGGAARAMAVYLGSAIGSGSLTIVNRDQERGRRLAADVKALFGNATSAPDSGLIDAVRDADLVVNASTRGQSGLRRSEAGVFSLEPYAALAAANPPVVPADTAAAADAPRLWLSAARASILDNHTRSLEVLDRLRPDAALFDIIYSPLETMTMRFVRWSGRRTLNGRTMNIAQAADGFANRVIGPLEGLSPADTEALYRKAFAIMAGVW
jgi:shikimate dehydrogenase